MSSLNSTPPSKFSANTKQLKRFQTAQKFRIIIPIGLVVCMAIATLWAYNIYQRSTSLSSDSNTNNISPNINDISINENSAPAEPQEVDVVANGNVSPPAGGSSTQNPGRSTTGGSSPSAPTSNGIPGGVTAAMSSIESSGVINNPYIMASTEGLPGDTSVVFNRASWRQYGDTMGTVNATISAQGQSGTATITFETVSGAWKVTGYSLAE